MSVPTKNKFNAAGYAILGTGLFYQAATQLGLFGSDASPPETPTKAGGVAALGRQPALRSVPTGSSSVSGVESEGGNVRVKGLPSAGRFGVLSRTTLHRVDTIEERVAFIQDRVRKDSLKSEVKEKALSILTRKVGARGDLRWAVEPKNYLAEVAALYKAIQDPNSPIALRYTRDHVTVDQFMAADKLMRLNGGDCFPNGTVMLREDGHALVAGETLRVGDRIWGKDRWTTVTKTWNRGFRETWRIRLNNGSAMRLSPDHHVFVLRCDRHVNRTEKSAACSCQPHERREERIEVRELKKGDVVTRPERIPFGTGEMDSSRALVEGLYLSDGWHEPGRFAISGQDGKPKEAQKRAVQAICAELGIRTKWSRKYLRIYDAEWSARLATMGTHAPMKHALSIDFTEGPALHLLRGIMADSGKNSHGRGRTFTTTSHDLFVQTRVLLKMAGVTCGERYITDHGGLGTNPVWRLQTWGGGAAEKMPKLLRITGIDKDRIEVPCFDLETEDGYVWLPEHDVTVSNCDDGAILLGAMLRSVGYPVRLRVIQDRGSDSWSHIYLLTGVPPMQPAKWIPLDWSVIPFKPVGWEAPGAAQVAATGKPSGIVVKLKDFAV